MSQRVTEAELLARIERGERIESTEEMTEEYRPAAVMYGLLADLGVDVDAHVRAHDEAFAMRIDASADDIAPLASAPTSA